MNLLYFLTKLIAGFIGICGVLAIIVLAFVYLWWLILPVSGLAFIGLCLKFAFGD